MLPAISDQDLKQRYGGTYLKLLINETPIVSEVLWVGEHLINLSTHGEEKTKNVSIIQEFPAMGLVNYENNVHLVSRVPLRQWSRGLKKELVFDFCRNKPQSCFNLRMPLAAAEALFNRVWVSPQEGLETLRKGLTHSFAINNSYWFSGNSKHQYVWRNSVCIGEIVGKRIFFFPESSLLQEEVNTDLKDIYAHF